MTCGHDGRSRTAADDTNAAQVTVEDAGRSQQVVVTNGRSRWSATAAMSAMSGMSAMSAMSGMSAMSAMSEWRAA